MLLGQITNTRIQLRPSGGVNHKPTSTAVATIDWRQLKEVATQDHLDSAKRRFVLAYLLGNLVHHIKSVVV